MAKSKYDPDITPLKAQDLARRGLNDKQIAESLGIHVSTLYDYQKQHPEFSKALKEGKKPVDVEVENALLKRAKGFEYEETLVEFRPKEKKKDSKKDEKAKPVKIKKTTKFVPPDTRACETWLRNRRPENWRSESLELGGKDGGPIPIVFVPVEGAKIKKSNNMNSAPPEGAKQ